MNLKTLAASLALATAVTGGVVSCAQKDAVPNQNNLECVLNDVVNNKNLKADEFAKSNQTSAELDNLFNKIKEGNLSMLDDGNVFDKIASELNGKEVVFRHGEYVTPSEAKWIDIKDSCEEFANTNPQLASLLILTGLAAAGGLTSDAVDKIRDCISKNQK